MNIDLKPFCGQGDIRYYLNSPFSEGEFTYAMDGHILIRVARMADVPEIASSNMKNKIQKMFEDNPAGEFIDLPNVPEPIQDDCDCCNGEGRHHTKCGSDTYPCEECNSTGKIAVEPGNMTFPEIEVGNSIFAPRYLRLLKTLQNCRLSPNEQKPAPFTFDGGDGLLMPMRKQP